MSSNITGAKRRATIWTLAIVGAFFALGVSALLTIWILNRYVEFEVETAGSQRSVRVHTRLGTFEVENSQGTSRTLMAVIYPGSIFEEQVSFDYYGGQAGQERKRAQLVLLRFSARVSLLDLDSWYRRRLGPEFTKVKGWPVSAKGSTAEWIHEVQRDPVPEAVVYQQEFGSRVRGVLLHTGTDGQMTFVTLYDYQRAPSCASWEGLWASYTDCGCIALSRVRELPLQPQRKNVQSLTARILVGKLLWRKRILFLWVI